MARLIFISHPQVVVDAQTPITDWGLNTVGHQRAACFARSATLPKVSAIWSSTETKALETAQHLANHLRLPVHEHADLGENDRSATGYLPPAQFEAAADTFFAEPEKSFNGWERAVDAQQRIVSTVERIIGQHAGGDLAIVSHGAVGTLLFCAWSENPISRSFDQGSQGHYWTADLDGLKPQQGWTPID